MQTVRQAFTILKQNPLLSTISIIKRQTLSKDVSAYILIISALRLPKVVFLLIIIGQ